MTQQTISIRATAPQCHFIQRTTTTAIAITTTVKTNLRHDGRGPQAAAVSSMFGVGGVGGVIGS